MLIKNYNTDDFLEVKNSLKNNTLCKLFEGVFNRYQEYAMPFFKARINSENSDFYFQKIDRLSKILINELLTAEEIYFSAKQVIKQFQQKQPLTEREAEGLFDYMIVDLSLALLAQGDKSVLSDVETKFIQKWGKLDPYFLWLLRVMLLVILPLRTMIVL